MINLMDERFITVIAIISTFFILVNVEKSIGALYSGMAILYLIGLWTKAPKVQIFKQPVNILRLLGGFAVGMLVFIIFVTLLTKYVFPSMQITGFSLNFIKDIKEFTNIPVLSEDPLVRKVIYGIIVPVVESMFFLSFVLAFYAKLLNYPIGSANISPKALLNVKALMVASLVGATASLFHLTARLASDYALFIDFVFFTVSALLVLATKEQGSALFMHNLVNLLVV